jgi:CRP-like cAMP-binding protein
MSPSKTRIFDPKDFLAKTGLGRTMTPYPKNKVIFVQGESSDAVFYIQKGRAKLTVLSTQGKEATIALGKGDFMANSLRTDQFYWETM